LNPVRLGEVPCDRGFEGEIHADAANAANAEDEGLVEVWEDGDIGIGRGSLLPNISMALALYQPFQQFSGLNSWVVLRFI